MTPASSGPRPVTFIWALAGSRSGGKLEKALSAHFADRTRWQALLRGLSEEVDFDRALAQARDKCPAELLTFLVEGERVQRLQYPVDAYADKARSLRLDKLAHIQGRLRGIVGQYFLFAQGGFNLRRHSGYVVEIQTD